MDISNWTVEDFVAHQGFVDGVLRPNTESSRYWEGLLEKNPQKKEHAKQAREIVLRMRTANQMTDQDKEELWGRVQDQILADTSHRLDKDMLSKAGLREKKVRKTASVTVPQVYRVAAILCLAVGLSWIVNLSKLNEEVVVHPNPPVYVEHRLPAGVKSSWTLPDGSKIAMNAGSSLRFIKGFENDRRVLHLEGEAYFEVQKDSLRPFIVYTGKVSTTAIGTSFNISAYKPDSVNVYLLTGKAVVADSVNQDQQIFLEKGEAATRVSSGAISKQTFNEEEVMAWTKGIIIFDKTPINVAIATLENWYGVTFELQNLPPDGLTVSGKFDNEQLKNILEGLSYSARFFFEIEDKKVTIRFQTL